MGALVEITLVDLRQTAEVREANVDLPRTGAMLEARTVDVAGWVLGATTTAIAMEVHLAGCPVSRLTLDRGRPDVAAAFRNVPGAQRAGFHGTISLVGRDPEVQLELRAVLADGRRVLVAMVRGRRLWRQSAAPPERELVSIAVACRDQSPHLADALDSVLAQTYPHVEIVLVDDGSLETGEIPEHCAGIRVVRQEGEGLAAARNTGIRQTNGDYLVFLDAGDQLLPHAIEMGVRHLQARADVAAVSAQSRPVAPDGSALPAPSRALIDGDPYAALLRRNVAGMSGTTMFRRGVFEQITGFDGSVPGCEDYELHLRVARQFSVSLHDEVIGLHRHGPDLMGCEPEGVLRSSLATVRRQRRYVRGDPHLEAAFRDGEAVRGYAEPLRERIAHSAREHDWRSAARGVVTLAAQRTGAILAVRRKIRRAPP